MPLDEDYDEDLESEFEDDEESDDDDDASDVFVSIAFGRPGAREVYDVIRKVCESLDLTAHRAPQDQPSSPTPTGSDSLEEAVESLVDECDFAVLDVTHKRPSLEHEIELCDREFDPAFVLVIAKKDSPRFGSFQERTIHTYDDLNHLRALMTRQLEVMIEAWDGAEDEEDESDE